MAKKILIGILAVLAIIILFSLFLPSEVSVERSTVMKATPERIYGQISNFQNWGKWSVWAQRDSTMEIVLGDTYKGAGASYSWEGDPDITGKGSMKILEATPHESMRTEIDFGEMGMAYGSWTLEPVDEGTKVTWGFTTSVSSPPIIGKFFGLMMDGFVGPDFEEGLANLKNLVESMPAYTYEIGPSNFGPVHYAGITRTTTMEELGGQFNDMAMIIYGYLQKNKIETTGPPVAIYHSWGAEVTFTFGFRVDGPVEINHKEIKYGMVEEGPYIKGVYMGPYEKMEPIYNQLDQYMKEFGYMQTGGPVEEYITDPMAEPDTAKWVTNVYFPTK